jgi:hypothetical protein
MIFCARATRGLGMPSLDARSWDHPSHRQVKRWGEKRIGLSLALRGDPGTGRNWLVHIRNRGAGPVVGQPDRPRTLPGIGEEGWPARLLCSRNARP